MQLLRDIDVAIKGYASNNKEIWLRDIIIIKKDRNLKKS